MKVIKSSLWACTFALFAWATTISAAELTLIRIGWQVPWTVQGQVVQIWQHTDILKKHGLKADFVGRTYGPQLNEAALAGQVDVILTADQPAAILFSKNKGWVGIARLMYNRTTTYVPLLSPIKTMADLRGKTICVPFGAAAERVLVEALQKAGLDPKKDVTILNLGMLEHAPLIQGTPRGDTTWGICNACAGFDPIPAILEGKTLVRTIDTGKVVSLVLTNQEFMQKHPGVDKRIAAALVDAYDYYRQHTAQANDWFLAEAKLVDPGHKACSLTAELEPNLAATSKAGIRVSFTDEDYLLMQKGADFVAPMTKKQINMRDFVSSPK